MRRLLSAPPVVAAAILVVASLQVGAQQEARDEFFIVSSVNSAKGELLVKQPTEVTQVMRVDADTKYADRQGKSIGLGDFRAGDTVYIVWSRKTGVAREIRKGPMTIAELQRRYLGSGSGLSRTSKFE